MSPVPLYSTSRDGVRVATVPPDELALRAVVASLTPSTDVVAAEPLVNRFLSLPADAGGYGRSRMAPSDRDRVVPLMWEHAAVLLSTAGLAPAGSPSRAVLL
ncbi:hypothetical protein [Murinocardiopsis flavida]|uniref:hypothetical protein n=1 Tax=Murinocardiopsis flavida TaxID=645275 RepID=UPI0011B1F3BF|nr:hypothetical protein [Murinocardiopsis flavida]